jgi:hypothetical protein
MAPDRRKGQAVTLEKDKSDIKSFACHGTSRLEHK